MSHSSLHSSLALAKKGGVEGGAQTINIFLVGLGAGGLLEWGQKMGVNCVSVFKQ